MAIITQVISEYASQILKFTTKLHTLIVDKLREGDGHNFFLIKRIINYTLNF